MTWHDQRGFTVARISGRYIPFPSLLQYGIRPGRRGTGGGGAGGAGGLVAGRRRGLARRWRRIWAWLLCVRRLRWRRRLARSGEEIELEAAGPRRGGDRAWERLLEQLLLRGRKKRRCDFLDLELDYYCLLLLLCGCVRSAAPERLLLALDCRCCCVLVLC